MDDLYIIQGSSKIEIVHKFLYIPEITGSILQVSIEWSNIHVGIGRNIYSLDYELYGDLLHRSWIKNLWNFSHGYGIYLPTSPTQIDLHIEGYLFPMKQLSHSGFMLRQLKKLNRCQLYLQIHTFYDISNGHGTYFDKIYYDGHQDGFHKSTYSWPAQGYPVTKKCQLWCKALRKFLPSDINSTYLHNIGKWADNRKKNVHSSIIRNYIVFSLKVPRESSGKSTSNCTHEVE